MSSFVTFGEVQIISGVEYDDWGRVEILASLVSDLIRTEGAKAGINVDERVSADSSYESVVKLIVCDVIARAMRQSKSGDPLSQESQSALGYTWSGTYAIPGGGVAMSLMNNERKMLGFKRQKYGVLELWDGSQAEQ